MIFKSSLILVIAILALFVGVYLTKSFITFDKPEEKSKHQNLLKNKAVLFDLLDPEMAPQPIHEAVMKGYNILLYTNKILPEYVEDRLTCSNCHFSAGNTLGGKNGGISLVGVPNIYPRYSDRFGRIITLKERINNCFERSMNGKPLPENSDEMLAILTYLQWISSKIPISKEYPWLGLKPLTSPHVPNAADGLKIYQQYCAMCHMDDGQGNEHDPPLWGPHAYNEGAGMSTLPKLSSFIYDNMPYEDAFLTQEQALDVAAYLLEQRRPKF